MIQHSFIKNASDTVKESVTKAFGKLETVSKMEPNRFEQPLTSIRRILGDRFYESNNMSSDIIRLIIYDNGGFKKPDLKLNYEKGNEMLQFISMLFQGFIELNENSTDFTKEFVTKPCAKLCITSTEGLVSHDVGMEFLYPVSSLDDNQKIVAMKNMLEIAQVSGEIQKADEAIQQMQNIGNNATIDALQKTRIEYTEKLAQYQSEIIDSFFEILEKFNNTDNVEDIFDVSFVFGKKMVDPEGKEKPLVETFCISYHDVASANVEMLKSKFNVKD